MSRRGMRRWVATADAAPARLARVTLRTALRLRARLRSGSVSAYMDEVVAGANSATIGSALSPELRARRRRRPDSRARETARARETTR